MHSTERMRWFRTAALVAGGCLLLVYAAVSQSLTPTALVDRYEHAWGYQDVDGALALLADNASITYDDPRTHSITSRDKIRAFLREAALSHAPLLTSARQVDASTVTWSERVESHVLSATELTVQAVVADGKIQSLVYRSGRPLRGTTKPASATPPESAGAVLAGVLLVGMGLLSLAGVRSQARSASNLRGRLLADLRLWSARPKTSARAPTAPVGS